MIAVDTNILVYAHRGDSRWNQPALAVLLELASGPRRWAIPWPCVHEFLAVVTHPRIYAPPTPIATALRAVDVWLSSAGCRAVGEGRDHLAELSQAAIVARLAGGAIHDARIAAICMENGVTQLWSADRDFSRFPRLRVVNPLLARPEL